MFFVSCVSHLSRLFIAALWSPAGIRATSWLLLVMFIVILLLSHVVPHLGQVWYLIISFPDLCRLSYLVVSYKRKYVHDVSTG